MSAEIDRAQYCKRVGIHRVTLTRWVREAVVSPARVGKHARQVFTEDDVHFGRALISLHRKYPGRYTLAQRVEIVRGERSLDENHDPRKP